MEKQRIGELGEKLAADFLEKRGYRILARNFKILPFGELDIIARAPEGVLVFVEVKTLIATGGGLIPEDNLTAAKLQKLKKASEITLLRKPGLLTNVGWQIDLVAVSFDGEDKPQIRHYQKIN